MRSIHPKVCGGLHHWIWAGVVLALAARAPAAQVSADQAAGMLLSSANKAYNEKNFAFAVTRYREFLNKFGNHSTAPAARYGLALTLLQIPGEKNDAEARDLLQALAGNPNHP